MRDRRVTHRQEFILSRQRRVITGHWRRCTRVLPVLVAGVLCGHPLGGWAGDANTEALAAARAGDYARAFHLWQPLAEGGDALAQYNLGVLHERGLGRERDEAQAMGWYRAAAAQGHGWAAYNLAGQFRDGRGIAKPAPEEAARWYRQAALGGVPDAAWVLARAEVDAASARRWLGQAARGGVPEAQLAWAEALLAEGSDADPRRRREALDWVQKAHAGGAAGSCRLLARAHAEGWWGRPPDAAAAAAALRSGAEAGDAECQRRLGLAYGRGAGVVQDYGQAVFWYTRAARGGDAEAQYLLGLSFRLGRGLVPSLAQAWAWCRLAAERGHAGASEALPLIEQDLRATPGEEERAGAALAEIRRLLHATPRG